MFKSIYLDVAIGMVFIYLLYSLLTTAIQELLASWLRLRGKYLFKGISSMLRDKHLGDKLGEDFKSHPLIQKLIFSKRDKFPSYISPDFFSKVVRDILPDVNLGKERNLSEEEKIQLLPGGELKKILSASLKNSTNSIDTVLQDWFNQSMERLSGVYKRVTQVRIFIIGLLIAIVFNVDSISIFRRLSKDKTARDLLVNQAIKFSEINKNYDSLKQKIIIAPVLSTDSVKKINSNDSLMFSEFQAQKQKIKNFLASDLKEADNTIGIGWENLEGKNLWEKLNNKTCWENTFMFFGWFITSLALTLGAPFWFDMLQKLVKLRGTGGKPN